MKRILPLFVLMLFASSLMAQTTLRFTGRDAENNFVPLSKVEISNLTKNWQETIFYPDTILEIDNVGIDDYGNIESFNLSQNVPNPFNGTSDFSLCLPKGGQVLLEVYDLNGKEITSYRNTLSVGCHIFRVLLTTPQSYVLTARSGNDQATIKMVNTGNAGANALLYVGEGNNNSLQVILNNAKGKSKNPFSPGDEMKYVGYAVVGGKEYESQTIQQPQDSSQTFILRFEIQKSQIPTVTTMQVTDVLQVSATCGGEVTSDGGEIVTTRGVCWNTSQNPTVSDNHTTDGSGVGKFISKITDLSANTTYYVRAYATNSLGTAYGEQVSFTTFDMPTVVTAPVSEITKTSALSGGDVTSDGGVKVTAYGVCWGTTQNPTVSGHHTTDGNGLGKFTSNMTGLTPNTTYYVRAYATSNAGTAYGNTESFTTDMEVFGKPCPGVETVADHEGNVYNTVIIGTQCWTKENMRCKTSPSTGTNIMDDNDQDGSISFVGKKVYYVNNDANNTKAYGLLYNWLAAVDTFNTQFGETAIDDNINNAIVVNFGNISRRGICPQGWHVPSEAEWTKLVDYLKTQKEYVCGSDENNVSKALASTMGWTVSETPCAIGNDLLANNATGFSAMPAGQYNAKYNFFGNEAKYWTTTLYRGNGARTAGLSNNDGNLRLGGANVSPGFSVRCIQNAAENTTPMVKTSSVSKITNNAAMCSGEVVNDGGAAVTARGVCWSLMENPSLNDSYTTDGSGIGIFTSNITNLTPNTTYYVRAYATNSEGTAYGELLHFKTKAENNDGKPCPSAATVTDHEGNVYNTVQIGTQCWTKENMRSTTSPSTGTVILDTKPKGSTFTGKKAYYVNGNADNATTYGLLYNWCAAVDTFNTAYAETNMNTSPSSALSVTFSGFRRGICPQGWHVPSHDEWSKLTEYVSSQSEYICGNEGNNSIAKALAFDKDWNENTTPCAVGNNQGENNATGFSAYPVGMHSGLFRYFSEYAYFWTATEEDSSRSFKSNLIFSSANVDINHGSKGFGYSVRCIKDTLPKIDGAPCPDAATVTDHEGNVYNTVQIGNQCWTRENMRCKTSPSTKTTIWEEMPSSSYTGKKACYANGDAVNVETYGLLYNWCAAVDTFNTAYGETSVNKDVNESPNITFSSHRRGICPQGWHVPSDAEWTQLTNYVSSKSQYHCEDNKDFIAKALTSTKGWENSEETCSVGNLPENNNATGFSVIPAGGYGETYEFFGMVDGIWSSTQFTKEQANARYFIYVGAEVSYNYGLKDYSYSVRCLKD